MAVVIVCSTIVAILIILIIGLAYFIPAAETAPIVEQFRGYAVASNGTQSAEIGKQIFEQGGSAADAAIATMFCEGVVCPESTGIGGGFFMTIYTKSTGKVETLIARETAPAAATADMFTKSGESSVIGGLSVAVPGELKGYYELHAKYGVLPWKDLVEPSINVCRNGHLVTPWLADALKNYSSRIKEIPSMSEVFINPETDEVWEVGDLIVRPKLAETLRIIANEGSDAIYGRNGSLRKKLADDIQGFGGIVTEDDLINYEVSWDDAVSTTFDGSNVYSVPLPGSGIILTLLVNILDGFLPETIDADSPILWQRVVEAYKHAYAHRSLLGDPKFVPDIKEVIDNLFSKNYAISLRKHIIDDFTSEDMDYYGANYTNGNDHGTANVCVLAPNGDAIAITGSTNFWFGACRRSMSTGILLNDSMDDFSMPGIVNAFGVSPSPANFIAPGKCAMSSMAPTIVVDVNGDVRLVVGGAGGTKITTAVSYILLRHLWLKESLEEAMSARRIHHQLAPMELNYEAGFNADVLAKLEAMGHKIEPVPRIASATAISWNNNKITACYDPRRGGSASVVNVE